MNSLGGQKLQSFKTTQTQLISLAAAQCSFPKPAFHTTKQHLYTPQNIGDDVSYRKDLVE